MKKNSKIPDFYQLVEDWPKIPEDTILHNSTGLGIDSENNILVFHRASKVWQEPIPEDKILKQIQFITMPKKIFPYEQITLTLVIK